MKRAFANTTDGQIHFRWNGTGDPIVMLHQSPLSSDSFIDVMDVLSRQYCVAAMDTLGYGYSDRPPKRFEIEDYARSVVNFLDALSLKRVNLVGHHTGATIAGEVAATYPDRVDRLILSGASLYSQEQRQALLDDPMFGEMNISADGSFLQMLWQHLRDYFSSVKLVQYSADNSGVWEYDAEATPLIDLNTVYRIYLDALLAGPRYTDGALASFRHNKEPRLPLIKSPTLVMCGSRDMLCDKIEAVKELIPHCEITVFDGSGDSIIYEKPAEFARRIIDFLEK